MTIIKKERISQQSSNDLKDVIIKHAQERGQTLANQIQNNYTNSFHDEIMISARESFRIKNNPFAIKEEKPIEEIKNKKEKIKNKVHEIESLKKQINDIKAQIHNKHAQVSNNMSYLTVGTIMSEAKNELSIKKSFTGALNFLNNQASICLLRSWRQDFEAYV